MVQGRQKEGEEQIVDAVRKYVLDNIDWECEVKVRFNERNLGCGKSVVGAITWFFENEKDGIILEDDCLPDPSFFGYCEQMLDYYKDDKRVWSILGDNPLGYSNIKYPYYFSRYPHPWGWASWADRWSYYEFDMTDYDQSLIDHYSKNKYVREDLSEVLRAMKNHEIDTWDYQ